MPETTGVEPVPAAATVARWQATAENTLDELARCASTNWLLYAEENDDPDLHEARYAFEQKMQSAREQLQSAYEQCDWADLRDDLEAHCQESWEPANWVRLRVYHRAVVKDYRCALDGEAREAFRRDLVADAVAESEQYGDGLVIMDQGETHHRLLWLRVQALKDLIQRLEVADLAGIVQCMGEDLPRELKQVRILHTRFFVDVLPQIREALGVEVATTPALATTTRGLNGGGATETRGSDGLIQLGYVKITSNYESVKDGGGEHKLPPAARATVQFLHEHAARDAQTGKTSEEIFEFVKESVRSRAEVWKPASAFNTPTLRELRERMIGREKTARPKKPKYWLR